MNSETWALVEDIATRVQHAVRAGDHPAIVGLYGDRNLTLSDYDYLISWATSLAFEIRAATQAQAIATHRWVFAVPQVWFHDGDTIQACPLFTAPLQLGETETISWMSYDEGDGIGYGRVEFARRPNGDPVFEEPEYFTTPMNPLPRHSGAALHRLLAANIPDLPSALPRRP
ncbi:hypothetical protein [Frankia sp. CiP3]|uniref:hypothetical protein n=1 Tax=Frankia sp. CiP3 TaxID=2880971 RepID=UPI001EF5E00D|nr:hypothetical protein [Frankia sp. CiP3]